MRQFRPIAALIVSFSSIALITTSCVQGSVDGAETNGATEEPVRRTSDFSENPDVCANQESDPLVTVVDVCIAAGKAGFEARRAFCNSSLVPPEKKKSCWSRALLSRTEWIGWCYWNF